MMYQFDVRVGASPGCPIEKEAPLESNVGLPLAVKSEGMPFVKSTVVDFPKAGSAEQVPAPASVWLPKGTMERPTNSPCRGLHLVDVWAVAGTQMVAETNNHGASAVGRMAVFVDRVARTAGRWLGYPFDRKECLQNDDSF